MIVSRIVKKCKRLINGVVEALSYRLKNGDFPDQKIFQQNSCYKIKAKEEIEVIKYISHS